MTPQEKRKELLSATLVKNLEKRHFEAYYCPTAAEAIEKAGLDIVCSALSKDSVPVHSFAPQKPFVLFIGGEKRGISAEFMEKAAKVVHIPYAREGVRYSLPAASVCAIYAFKLYGYACTKDGKEQ